MPYFVYKIDNNIVVKNLELLGEFEGFKEAKAFAVEQREAFPDLPISAIKVMFAKNKLDAEEQLQEHREAPILMEWEK